LSLHATNAIAANAISATRVLLALTLHPSTAEKAEDVPTRAVLDREPYREAPPHPSQRLLSHAPQE
jgi:hypothetical protein